jgi:hypothetical protein
MKKRQIYATGNRVFFIIPATKALLIFSGKASPHSPGFAHYTYFGSIFTLDLILNQGSYEGLRRPLTGGALETSRITAAKALLIDNIIE